jgi:carbohydrate-binding DOMON domain-containing protein
MTGAKTFLYIFTMLLLSMLLLGANFPTVYFEMADPAGDDYGYGAYQYPTNIAFQPYQGLFDMTRFKVWAEKPGEIYFDTRFGAITNPWAAPEGFIHQNLRVFIDTCPGGGLLNLPQPGAYLRFDPRHAWEVCLKIVGWENSQIMLVEGKKLRMWPLKTEVLGDGHTIRAQVPQSKIGNPTKDWNYYVFVGSYDGFGEDFFRKVKRKNSDWVIGGGLDQALEPQVMDLLAPVSGAATQEKQLSSFNRETGQLAQLVPVGGNGGVGAWLWPVSWAAGALIFGGLVVMVVVRPKKFSWFWVAKNKSLNR